MCANTAEVDSTLNLLRISASLYAGFLTYKHLELHSSNLVIRQAESQFAAARIKGVVLVADGSLLQISDSRAKTNRGGLVIQGGLRVDGGSTVRIERVNAASGGAGFTAVGDVVVSAKSIISISGSTGGGFHASGSIDVSSRSRISISHANATTGHGAGFNCQGSLRIAGHSIIEVAHAVSDDQGGGFLVDQHMTVSEGSTVRVTDCRALTMGGGFYVRGDMTVARGSEIILSNSSSGGDGGGFVAARVDIMDDSCLDISGAHAGDSGGGFYSDVLAVQRARVLIRNSTAAKHGAGFLSREAVLLAQGSLLEVARCEAKLQGGGFNAQAAVQVIENSTVKIMNTTAMLGGGFLALGEVDVERSHVFLTGTLAADTGGAFQVRTLRLTSSSLRIANATAKRLGGGFASVASTVLSASDLRIENTQALSGDGGAILSQALELVNGSNVRIWNCSAGRKGGGISAHKSLQVQGGSVVHIAHTQAGIQGGGLIASGVQLSDSTLVISAAKAQNEGGGFFLHEKLSMLRSHVNVSAEAGDSGGGFFAASLMVVDSELHVSGLPGERAAAVITTMGSGGFVQGPVHVVRSTLHFNELRGSSAMVAHCLELSQSALQVNAAADVGIALQNAACGCNTTLSVDGALSGRGVSSALLSLDGCADEALQISHVRFETKVAAVAKTRSHTLLNNITVEYLQPVTGETPILVSPSFQADAVEISCAPCDNGVTFHEENGLYAVSSSTLNCQRQASLVGGRTDVCDCKGQLVVDEDFRQQVDVAQTFEYCTYCLPQHEKRNGTCQKCPVHQVQRVAHLKCKKRGVILSS